MKTVTTVFTFLSLVSIFSCNIDESKLFEIRNTSHQTGNDFIFMAESTNIEFLTEESLLYYLNENEISNIHESKFKYFGSVFNNGKINVRILMKDKEDSGRNYTFIIRTYGKENEIKDSYEFASWIDSENKRCFGSINNELLIVRTCYHSQKIDSLIIEENGKINRINVKTKPK